jgi:hypothetical protein
VISNTVTSIGKGAFDGCISLASIVIPNSVTNIGEGAFRGCTSLASIVDSNSVTTIGEDAFDGCTPLASIEIPVIVLPTLTLPSDTMVFFDPNDEHRGKYQKCLGTGTQKAKIENKSDQKIKVIVSYQPMTVTVRTKMEAGVTVPYTSVEATVGREHEIQKGMHPSQEAVVLPSSCEAFELPWKNYYLTILTEQMDGSRVIHEKKRLFRSSQNWEFVQSDLEKQVEIIMPEIIMPPIQKKKKKWSLW